MVVVVCVEARNGYQIPWIWTYIQVVLSHLMTWCGWVLGANVAPSERAANAPNYWTLSPAPCSVLHLLGSLVISSEYLFCSAAPSNTNRVQGQNKARFLAPLTSEGFSVTVASIHPGERWILKHTQRLTLHVPGREGCGGIMTFSSQMYHEMKPEDVGTTKKGWNINIGTIDTRSMILLPTQTQTSLLLFGIKTFSVFRVGKTNINSCPFFTAHCVCIAPWPRESCHKASYPCPDCHPT